MTIRTSEKETDTKALQGLTAGQLLALAGKLCQHLPTDVAEAMLHNEFSPLMMKRVTEAMGAAVHRYGVDSMHMSVLRALKQLTSLEVDARIHSEHMCHEGTYAEDQLTRGANVELLGVRYAATYDQICAALDANREFAPANLLHLLDSAKGGWLSVGEVLVITGSRYERDGQRYAPLIERTGSGAYLRLGHVEKNMPLTNYARPGKLRVLVVCRGKFTRSSAT